MHQYAPSPASAPQFQIVPNDPIHVHAHTLSNGLKLFLSVNKEEPRIYTEIAVRAGSKHDPAETTGLAHYFEHMMFKGTDHLGSLDWANEKQLLEQIEELFEEHRSETDPMRKKELYAEIDRVSFEAAKFAAANEYDKLVSAIGAKNTNAYTWVEQTVYVNDIPSNELGRWFSLESERFRRPILRLFHTELETVFEEYNISQDRDFRKTMKAMQEVLTPTHPYGTQTTLGRGEDLKNPSQKNIYRFFDQYYVPNNMAIVLCGDFDPVQAVELAERHFGGMQAKPIPSFHFEPQPPLTQRVQRDVYGTESPWVDMGWRFEGARSEDALLLPLLACLLHNNQAGLFDINLIQAQQVLEAVAYPRIYEDYSSLSLQAKPREGQSLAEVERLLLLEVDKLRRGEFEDWLPEAVIKDMKLSEYREFDSNRGRAGAISESFILGLEWADVLGRLEKLARWSKQDIMAFAQQHLRDDNYVVVYKHTGEDTSVMKVEKPPITPIEVNRADASSYAHSFLGQTTPDIAPEFVDFSEKIKQQPLGQHLTLYAVPDSECNLFYCHYVYDLGRINDRRFGVLASYLPYLGTSKRTAVEMQQAFYRLGVNFAAICQDEHFYVSLSGLPESFEPAIALMEELLSDAQPSPDALRNLILDTLQERENDKLDKRVVLNKAMSSYAKYGPKSPFSDKIPKETLLALEPGTLLDLLQQLSSVEHQVFYHGPTPLEHVGSVLERHHPAAQATAPLTKPSERFPRKLYPEVETSQNQVYFVHFPMVQVELLLTSKGTPYFNLEEYIFAEWYNQYFGYGLSSIVFQEIRESKALAYSAYAYATTPTRDRYAHYLRAYVGTQPDKLQTAVGAFQEILENMPVSPIQIEHARQSVLRQISADRITKDDLFWTWRGNRDKGFDNRDLRADVYGFMQKAQMEDLLRFQTEKIKGRSYTWMVLGERNRIDFEFLKTIGTVKELTLEEIFGY